MLRNLHTQGGWDIMNESENIEEAIEVLQQLGLQEYEARCFVGLSRVETATAKQLSELTEVPRTRVYDAIRILEAQGLVEIHHSSPQQFRAVSLEEATETFGKKYNTRIERLENTLRTIDTVEVGEEKPVQQVWSMAGANAIENRTIQLIEDATDEIVLVLGDESLLTEELVDTLNAVDNRTTMLIGALTKALQDQIQAAVPNATTFISGLEWLYPSPAGDAETAIGRLVLVDRSAMLVSSCISGAEEEEEKAIYGEGFDNGLVVIARRLMAQGLLTTRDPAAESPRS